MAAGTGRLERLERLRVKKKLHGRRPRTGQPNHRIEILEELKRCLLRQVGENYGTELFSIILISESG